MSTSVSVSDLKAHLAKHLRTVKRGDEVQILERGVLVARLVPVRADTREKTSARRNRLIRAGVLRAGSGNVAELLNAPVTGANARVTEALLEDRTDRM